MAKIKNETEDSPKPKPKTRVVEAITTTKYKSPMVVPIEEIEEDEPEEFESLEIEGVDLDEFEEVKPPRKNRPTVKSQFDEIFEKAGIGDEALAVLRIERLPNFEKDGNCGVQAVRRFCGRIDVGPSFFDNDNHMDYLLKTYGPGAYWLTVRHKTKNLKMWLVQIDGSAQGAVARTEGEVLANPAPFVIQQPAPIAQKSFLESLREYAEIATLMNKLNPASANSAQNFAPPPAPVPEDIQIASILMKDPDIKAKAIKGLLGTAGQETDYLQLLIENGDKLFHAAGQMLQGVIQSAVIGVEQLRGPKNGQAQAGVQTNAAGVQAPVSAISHTSTWQENGLQQTGETNLGQMAANEQSYQQESQNVRNVSPEDQALDFILGQCQQKVPVKIAADRLFNIADDIRDRAPANSIDGYVEMFAATPLDSILEFLKTIPGAGVVLEMPHSRDWIASLQEEVAKVINEGGEDEN